MTFDVNDPRAVRSRAVKVGVFGYVVALFVAGAAVLLSTTLEGLALTAMLVPLALLVLCLIVAATLSLKVGSSYPHVDSLRAPTSVVRWSALVIGVLGVLFNVLLGSLVAALLIALFTVLAYLFASANGKAISK